MPELPPPVQPAENPFPNTVAGAGMVEPETENISIGSPVPGIVVEVLVKVGQKVKAGDPLFRLDDRELKAELAVRQAMLADAQAAARSDWKRCRARKSCRRRGAACARRRPTGRTGSSNGPAAKSWSRNSAMSEEEFMERKQSAIQARERYNRAVADYDLLKAGAWESDKRVAQVGGRSGRSRKSSRRKPNSIG